MQDLTLYGNGFVMIIKIQSKESLFRKLTTVVMPAILNAFGSRESFGNPPLSPLNFRGGMKKGYRARHNDNKI